MLKDAPEHVRISSRLHDLIRMGDRPCVSSQVYTEAWSVLTRPVELNGYGLNPTLAAQRIRGSMENFNLLPDPSGLFERWLSLCEDFRVLGRQGHDARIAAWMELHGVSRILTLNPGDFSRYPHIETIGLDV